MNATTQPFPIDLIYFPFAQFLPLSIRTPVFWRQSERSEKLCHPLLTFYTALFFLFRTSRKNCCLANKKVANTKKKTSLSKSANLVRALLASADRATLAESFQEVNQWALAKTAGSYSRSEIPSLSFSLSHSWQQFLRDITPRGR